MADLSVKIPFEMGRYSLKIRLCRRQRDLEIWQNIRNIMI